MKILICGYFGFGNAGDELILENIVCSLKNPPGGAAVRDISVLSGVPAGRYGHLGVKCVNRWNLPGIARSVSENDLVIFAGGLFQDATGTLSLYYYLWIVMLAVIFKRKTIFCSMDFGPISGKLNRRIFGLLASRVDAVYVRSAGSLEFLKDSGGNPCGRAKIGADVVLSGQAGAGGSANSGRGDRCRIALILREPVIRAGRKSADAARNAARICEMLSGKYNPELILLPFHLERDMDFSVRIAGMLNMPVRIARWNAASDLYGIISGADIVISQRLHGLILSSMMRRPVIAMLSDPKLGFFMKELCLDEYILPENDIAGAVKAAGIILSKKERYLKTLENKLPELRVKSMTWLDSVYGTQH